MLFEERNQLQIPVLFSHTSLKDHAEPDGDFCIYIFKWQVYSQELSREWLRRLCLGSYGSGQTMFWYALEYPAFQI